MKKIAVFTSGGDAPGMNACVRAVVRSGIANQLEIVGIKRGYEGMIDGDFEMLNARSVSNIIHRGGTILKSARSKRFRTVEGMEQAYQNLLKAGIEGVVAIGGDGTFRGATEFSDKYQLPFIGVPGTIDNDMFGTDFTIGYDTALNTAIDAIDKIRDTATAHDRLFFVEVMGRDAGFIALMSGLASGAEGILVPEYETDLDSLVKDLEQGHKDGKSSSIVVVAEGDDEGGAFEIAKKVKEKLSIPFDIRVSILGHIQRGGSPTCMDRVLASRLGVAAVEALIVGKNKEMVGFVKGEIKHTPFAKSVKHNHKMSENLVRIARVLAFCDA